MIDRLTMTRQQYDEYDLKAALLGRVYDWRVHTFYGEGGQGCRELDLDAETLDDLPLADAMSRRFDKNVLVYPNGWEGLEAYRRDKALGIEHVHPERGGYLGGKDDTS